MLHLFLSLSKTLQCRTSWGVSVRSPEQKLDQARIQRNTSDKLVVGIYQVKFLSNSVLWSCFLLNPSPGVSSPLEGKQPNLAVLAASVSSQLEKLSLHKQVQKFISSPFLFLIIISPETPSSIAPPVLLCSITSTWQTQWLACPLLIFWLILLRFPRASSHLCPTGMQEKKRDFSQVQKFTSPPTALPVPSGTAVSRWCMFIFPSQICLFHV